MINQAQLTDLETILTSVLSMLGISSPFIAALVRFAFREYNKLMSAAALIEAYDARFEEMDARLKAAGIKDPDIVVTQHIRQLRGSLKESFNRRDLRLSQMETRVEQVKKEQEAERSKAPISIPHDLNSLKSHISKHKVRIDELERLLKFTYDTTKTLAARSAPAPVPVPAPSADIEKVKQLEVSVAILRRALLKLANRLNVDLSFELHTPRTPAAPAPAAAAASAPQKVIDYKTLSKEKTKQLVHDIDEEALIEALKHTEEEEL